MSQADNVIFNPLERALAEDINDLQSVARSRSLGDTAAFSRGVPIADVLSGQGVPPLWQEFPGAFPDGVRNGVLGGLAVALQGVGQTSVTAMPGAVCYFDPAAGPDANYDPNSYQIGRLTAPLSIAPGGVWGGSAIPGAGTAFWVLVARPVQSVAAASLREVYDPGTGQFVTQSVNKLLTTNVEFLFIDDVSPLTYPGDDYQLLGRLRSDGGVITAFYDWRQMLSSGPAQTQQGPVDQDSVRWWLGAQQVHGLEYKWNGQRHMIIDADIPASTYLDPNDGPILQDQEYSMWTFDVQRVDGSFFRPPAEALNPQGPCNILLASEFGGNLYNTADMELPAAYDYWSNWILDYGLGDQVKPFYAANLGSFVTRYGSAEGQRFFREGRRLVNSETSGTSYFPTSGTVDGNRFRHSPATAVSSGGIINDVPLTLPDFDTELTMGRTPRFIKWKVSFDTNTVALNFATGATPGTVILWIKTSNANPSSQNTLVALDLAINSPVDFAGDAIDKTYIAPLEVWLPTALATLYLDIRTGSSGTAIFEDPTGVNINFDYMEAVF